MYWFVYLLVLIGLSSLIKFPLRQGVVLFGIHLIVVDAINGQGELPPEKNHAYFSIQRLCWMA